MVLPLLVFLDVCQRDAAPLQPLPQPGGYPTRHQVQRMENSPASPIYAYPFTIPDTAVDRNGHVNNVMYVQWMQDVAVRHYDFIGGTAPMQALGATWVVREHRIKYLRPAFAGEQVEIQTWVVNVHRVRSLRRYRFVRKSDDELLVQGETDWIFVDANTGRPRRIPEQVARVFTLLPD
jgi:acyl-CoA thioester hydrolase